MFVRVQYLTERKIEYTGRYGTVSSRVLIIEPEGERLLTVAKMAVAMQRPMANGADPLTSLRFSSQTPKTTSTRVNVEKNSTPNPCVGVRALCTSVTPSVLWNSLGVKALFRKQNVIEDIYHVNRKRNIIRSHLHHKKFGRSVGGEEKTWPEHLHTGGLANKVRERHKRRWALRWWSCAHAAAIPARPRDIIPSSRQQTGKKADFFFLLSVFPFFGMNSQLPGEEQLHIWRPNIGLLCRRWTWRWWFCRSRGRPPSRQGWSGHR